MASTVTSPQTDFRRKLLFRALIIATGTVVAVALVTGQYIAGAFSLLQFLAAGVGVLAAFYLDSVAKAQQDEEVHRRNQDRLVVLRGSLVAAVHDQWKKAKFYWFTNVQGTVAELARTPTDPELTIAEWTANGEEFLSLCAEREERSLFANFFDRIGRFDDLARIRENLKMRALKDESAHALVDSMILRMEQAWTRVHELGIRVAKTFGDDAMKREMGVS